MAIVARFGRQDFPPSPGGNDIRESICTIDDHVGHIVYLLDTFNGKDVVRKADPSDFEKMPGIGIIIEKESDTACKVQWRGETPSLFSGLDIGSIYFLDYNAGINIIPPPPVSGYMFRQIMGVAVTATKLYVNPVLEIVKRNL